MAIENPNKVLVIKVNRSLSGGGVTVGGLAQEILSDNIATFKRSFAANLTAAQIDMAIDVTAMTAFGIEATQNCTVKTNSAETPDDTIVLLKNVPKLWFVGDDDNAVPITADVTSFFIDTGAEETMLTILAGIDSTPVI